MSKIVNVAIVGCGGMGGGHAVAIATGSGQALWMTDGSKGRELAPGDTDLKTKMALSGAWPDGGEKGGRRSGGSGNLSSLTCCICRRCSFFPG